MSESGREASDWDDLILVGVVARTHGNRGEVIVNPETDFAEERFRPGAELQTRVAGGRRSLTITTARFHQGRPVLGLAGYSSISEAEALAGCELRVPVTEQSALSAGRYYHHQLVDCEVVLDSGEAVGRVAAVEGAGAASRLVVRGARKELLIPLAAEICTVDVAAKRITIRPPEGLLEL